MNQLLGKAGLPCICTIRKPKDAIVSWMTAFKFSIEQAVETFIRWLTWHRSMSSRVLNIRYEDIDAKPLLVIWKIGRYLVRDFGLGEAVKIWWKYRKTTVHKVTQELERSEGNTIDIGFSYYDKNTFFHRHHVTSLKSVSAESCLSRRDLDKIRYALRDFVDEKGNYEW